jgi:anti-sigma B factor antagonist
VLSIQAHHEGDRHTLLLAGELDMATAPELEQQAQRLCAQNPSELVLDMTRLEFIDSAGLNAVLKVRDLCAEHTCDFGLTPGARPVQRLFEVTRLIDRLPFREPRPGGPEASASPDGSPQTRGAEPRA